MAIERLRSTPLSSVRALIIPPRVELRVERVLIGFYVLFFATGFMGGTALLLLSMRVRGRLIQPLLAFQLAFLVATGLIVAYFSGIAQPGGLAPAVEATLITLIMILSIAVWTLVVALVRRVAPRPIRRDALIVAARFGVGLALAAAVLDLLFYVASAIGRPVLAADGVVRAWDLGSMAAFGLGMAGFGTTALRGVPRSEPAPMRALVRRYGVISLIFAPIGVIEFAVEAAEIPRLAYISLDHLFFAAWNVVSMGAAVHLFRPAAEGTPLFERIPERRVHELGLSTRETDIAVLIARGLTNKEMAAELNISPATVRTHIYNLYRKAGARSRVELINVIRS